VCALYLIVHTESQLGKSFHHGDLDPVLAPEGIAAIGPISKLFRNQKLDLIVTSSLSRTSETALMLASLTGAHIFVDEGLRTWKQGAFSGWSKDKAKAALKVYLRNPDTKVPRGESASHYLARWKRTFSKYQGMSKIGKLGIALVLNSLNVDAVAGKFKTVDLDFPAVEGGVYEVGPNLTLREIKQ
jgi:broad specificity phosphatase PhoE